MLKKLQVAVLVGAVVLVSAGACTAKPADDPPAPAAAGAASGAAGASSGAPSPAAQASVPVSEDFEISATPFKQATADQVVDAWTAKWHPRFRVIQNPAAHIRQAVMDNPYGRGTLELDVGQRGTGKDPGAVQVGFVLKDPSVKGYLTMTPKALSTLLQACFAPVLPAAEIKQMSSWLSSDNPNRETGAGHDFPGLRMTFLNFRGQFSVNLLSR